MSALREYDAAGLDLNEPDYDGRTAMHLAAAENRLEVVSFLIQRGLKLDHSAGQMGPNSTAGGRDKWKRHDCGSN